MLQKIRHLEEQVLMGGSGVTANQRNDGATSSVGQIHLAPRQESASSARIIINFSNQHDVTAVSVATQGRPHTPRDIVSETVEQLHMVSVATGNDSVRREY